MIAPFQLLGPSKGPYPGTVCLPQVPLPANMSFNAGDNATIQVVEIAQHGAALFSVGYDVTDGYDDLKTNRIILVFGYYIR